MNTLAVMCIALTSTRPSRTQLWRTASATRAVMFTNPTRPGTVNVKYSVSDFIRPPIPGPDPANNLMRNPRGAPMPDWISRYLPDSWGTTHLVVAGILLTVGTALVSLVATAVVLLRLPHDYSACDPAGADC